MTGWLIPSLLALCIWGLWGFLPKITTQYLQPRSAIVYEVLGALLFGAILTACHGARPEYHPKGALFGALTGLSALGGALLYLHAAKNGPLAAVVTLTALYPVVTILLSYLFLGEPITLKQMSGMLFAVIAIYLLAT